MINNLRHEIVKKMSSNPKYYGKLSEMLEEIIEQRRIEALSYEEYLRQVVELANSILHPEESGEYPDSIKDSAAKRALYDFFDDEALAITMDLAIRASLRTDWKKSLPKQRNIQFAIYEKLREHAYDEAQATSYVKEVFAIIERQEEYDI